MNGASGTDEPGLPWICLRMSYRLFAAALEISVVVRRDAQRC